MGGLAERFPTALDPVGNPIDHLAGADSRRTVTPMGCGAVVEQGRFGFVAGKINRFAHPLAKLLADFTDGKLFGPGNVDHPGGTAASASAARVIALASPCQMTFT